MSPHGPPSLLVPREGTPFVTPLDICFMICAKENTKLKLKLDFSIVKQEIEKEGYILLSTKEEYINNTSKLRMICPKGHKCEISWSNFQQGKRCRECAIENSTVGKSRQNIFGYFEHIPPD